MNRSFSIASRLAELGQALDRIEEMLLEHSVENDLAAELRLVAEEGLVNIVNHGCLEDEEEIELTISVNLAEVRIVLRDRGRPFDPLGHPAPDLSVPREEQGEGGLGIHLIRALTDDQAYSREGDENVLVLVKRRGVL